MMRQLELYIHIPFCMKKCSYCDFLSFVKDEAEQKAYVEALLREIDFYGKKYRDYAIPTVFLGGGTPSWLGEEEIQLIMGQIRRSFLIMPDAEITIECNPGTVTDWKFQVYRQLGINRLSIGLQSPDDEELQILGRVHTFAQFLKMYDSARQNGFDNINVDVMSALPGQTVEHYYHNLQQVVRLKPEHISAYSLMIEKGTPFYDLYKFDAVKQEAGMQTEILPSEDEVYQMNKVTEQFLQEAGYLRYEVSNYALKGRECRHNIGYWRRANYLGMGLGASSMVNNVRYTNVQDFYEYLEQTQCLRDGLWRNEQGDGETVAEELPATNLHVSAERLTRNAQIEEFMFLGLRMMEGVSREEFERCFGVPIEGVYQDVMQRLIREELLVKRAGWVFLTERGQDLSNYVLAQFLL